MNKIKKSVQEAKLRLLYSKPFFHIVLSFMNGPFMNSELPGWAAIKLRPQSINFDLLINPEMWIDLTNEEQEAILVHECMHIINNHLNNKIRKHMGTEPVLQNIAMDLAINQHIKNMPATAIHLQAFEKFGCLPNAIAEVYYEQLLPHKNEVEKMVGHFNFDNHQFVTYGEEISTDLRKQAVRKLMSDSIARAKNSKTGNAWGNVPGNIQKLVLEILHPKINWRKQLQRFTGASIKTGTRGTRKRYHRRFGQMQPGRKTIRNGHLLVAIDTSASVSDKELNQFFAEIDRMSEMVDITIAEVDTMVQRVWKYNRRQRPNDIAGRGGTSFQVLWDELIKPNSQLNDKYNGIIYLTDGYAPWPQGDGGYSTLWVFTTKDKVDETPFGTGVFLDIFD